METKTKAHTRYRLKDNSIVPGVTTILGILAKPQLIVWANKMGLQGIDSTKYRDAMADIGTLAHKMITSDLKGEKCDTSEYSAQDIEKAENCLIKYWDWVKVHPINPILVEEPLISETYHFGGTIDCLAGYEDELWLIDFKTGKAIYEEMIFQLAAYSHLLQENGTKPTNVRILRVGRDETEGFEEKVMVNLDKQWQIFLSCLAIYTLQKEVRKGE